MQVDVWSVLLGAAGTIVLTVLTGLAGKLVDPIWDRRDKIQKWIEKVALSITIPLCLVTDAALSIYLMTRGRELVGKEVALAFGMAILTAAAIAMVLSVRLTSSVGRMLDLMESLTTSVRDLKEAPGKSRAKVD